MSASVLRQRKPWFDDNGFGSQDRQTTMKKLCTLLVGVTLAGCSQHYSDLERQFGVEKLSNAPALDAHTLVIFSREHRGANSYRDIASIRTSDAAIEIRIGFPFMKPLRIPAEAVAGCGMTCFGTDDQHVDLLIPVTGSDVMIPRTEPLLDWCWRNKKPMFPSSIRRDWQYKGITLPPAGNFGEQFVSRANYDHQTQMSCLGY